MDNKSQEHFSDYLRHLSIQLTRIENDLSKFLVENTKISSKLETHVKEDLKLTKMCFGVFGFIFIVHASEAVAFIEKLLT